MDKQYSPRPFIFTPRACPKPPGCGLLPCECSFVVDHLAIAVCNYNRVTDDTFEVALNGEKVGTVGSQGELPFCYSPGTGLWAVSAPFPTWGQFVNYFRSQDDEDIEDNSSICAIDNVWQQGRLVQSWIAEDENILEITYTGESKGCGNLGGIQVWGLSLSKRRVGWCWGQNYGGAWTQIGGTPDPEQFTIPYGKGEMITHSPPDQPAGMAPAGLRVGTTASGVLTVQQFAATAGADLIAARLAVCEGCDYRAGENCGCGEPLVRKAGRLYGLCPRWKWQDVNRRFGL